MDLVFITQAFFLYHHSFYFKKVPKKYFVKSIFLVVLIKGKDLLVDFLIKDSILLILSLEFQKNFLKILSFLAKLNKLKFLKQNL